VVVALVALVGRGAGETVIRPVGGDGADPSGGGTPDDLQEPADDDWQYEEPSDNPANDDTELDFGNDPYADGSDDGGGTGSIPDSLADFDPAGRVDLVNQDEDDGGTWVGL
jgi:hypothetical protein